MEKQSQIDAAKGVDVRATTDLQKAFIAVDAQVKQFYDEHRTMTLRPQNMKKAMDDLRAEVFKSEAEKGVGDVQTRLKGLEQKLKDRGVKDVKFFWGPLDEKPLSQIAEDVCEVLEAVLSGNTKPLPPIGDSQKPTPLAADAVMVERATLDKIITALEQSAKANDLMNDSMTAAGIISGITKGTSVYHEALQLLSGAGKKEA